jgi:hypothetical protein
MGYNIGFFRAADSGYTAPSHDNCHRGKYRGPCAVIGGNGQ